MDFPLCLFGHPVLNALNNSSQFFILHSKTVRAFLYIHTGMKKKILIKSRAFPAWTANNLLQPVYKVAKYTVLLKAINPQWLRLPITLLNANYFGKKPHTSLFVKRKGNEHPISLQ